MIRRYLDFEKPLEELHQQIERLRELSSNGNESYRADVKKLTRKLTKLRQDIFHNAVVQDEQQAVALARYHLQQSVFSFCHS